LNEQSDQTGYQAVIVFDGSDDTDDTSEVIDVSPLDALLPERHPQYDLFICDVADAVIKDLMPNMEHPFYSLSKKPERTVRTYEHNGQWLRVTPSVRGLATIYDKDILIYCVSQVIAKMKNGERASKRIRLNTRDLLQFTNRGTGGKDYKALSDALERIRGTTITTNIKTGNKVQTDTFGLIESSSIKRINGKDGRMISCEVTLSDWVFNAIRDREVLTLHRDYFRLRKPLERRIYEVARKHCGRQTTWKIKLENLLKKCGSASPIVQFRQKVKEITKTDHLPDYHVEYDRDQDLVIFVNKGTIPPLDVEADGDDNAPWGGALPIGSIDDAREVAPGWDPHYLESQWRQWVGDNDITPNNPGKHFRRFCQTWFDKRGTPS